MATTDTDLEALVGHLFIVGGRTVSSPSPGAVAMPPPRHPARGRDSDSLFALLNLDDSASPTSTFYETVIDELAETFFATGGGVTTALKAAIDAANVAMYEINRSRMDEIDAGLACAVLREGELYLATIGPARCFLIQDGRIERLPPGAEMAEGVEPLGYAPTPDIRMYHRDVAAGDMLLLAGLSFDRVSDGLLNQATAGGRINQTLSSLAGLMGEFGATEVIQFVEPLAEGELDAVSEAPESRQPAARRAEASAQVAPAGGAAAPGRTATTGRTAAPGRAPARPAMTAGERARKSAQTVAQGLATGVQRLRLLIEKMLPEGKAENPLSEQLGLSTTVQIAIVVGVTLVAALLTVAVYRYRGQTSRYAQLVLEAQSEIEAAHDAGSDQGEARPHWELAVFMLDQAAQIRAPGDEIAALRSEALDALDDYDQVTRVEPILLRAYDQGATLRGPIVNGLNLYTIDTAQNVLYREDLNDDFTELTTREPQVITRQGELIGSQVVGNLIDLEWMEDGGVEQRNVLAVLTDNGLLLTYSPSWDVTATLLPGSDAWADPRAIAIHERNLYVLDAGASEIWRYETSGDSYSSAPQRYFTDVIPDLSDAVDMEIDTNGNVYVLHGSGAITKYFSGRQEGFAFEALPQPIVRATAMSLNLSPYDRTLFIADAGGGRLYTSALNGTILGNYRDGDDVIFDSLSGVFHQDQPSAVFVTAGNGLYYFSRP